MVSEIVSESSAAKVYMTPLTYLSVFTHYYSSHIQTNPTHMHNFPQTQCVNRATGFQRIKIGDILLAIDGVYIHQLSHENILQLLKKYIQEPYVYLRFLRMQSGWGQRVEGLEAYLAEVKKPTYKSER